MQCTHENTGPYIKVNAYTRNKHNSHSQTTQRWVTLMWTLSRLLLKWTYIMLLSNTRLAVKPSKFDHDEINIREGHHAAQENEKWKLWHIRSNNPTPRNAPLRRWCSSTLDGSWRMGSPFVGRLTDVVPLNSWFCPAQFGPMSKRGQGLHQQLREMHCGAML